MQTEAVDTRRRRRRILLDHSKTIHSTHKTVAGCQKRQMSITLATLTKTHTQTHTHTHTHTQRERERERKEITYEHKATKKERKDSEITQYEITHGVWHTLHFISVRGTQILTRLSKRRHSISSCLLLTWNCADRRNICFPV